MTEQVIAPNQIIRNVATLDLRTTAEATFATIKQIENVAAVLYSAETAAQLPRLNMSNVAATIEVPIHARILSGQTTLSQNALQHQHEPLTWVVSGQVTVEDTLSPEEVDRGLESLIISGQVLCPEHLAGVLHSKIKHMSGQFLVYATNTQVVLGKLALTEPYLRQLPDGTSLLILGRLSATQALPSELLAQKLGQVQVYGKVICAEENSSLVRNLQGQPLFGEVMIVPSGFELVERPLVLDAGLLETLSARKLYCTGLVHFDEDVTPDALEGAIDKLMANRLLLAPSRLRKVLAQKCDLLNTKAIFYEGKLWLIEGDVILDQARFEVFEGQATLVVLGAVRLEPTIDPGVLAARLHRVHNLGEIAATTTQLATLQARAGLNEGEWLDASRQTEENANERVVGNMAYLKL